MGEGRRLGGLPITAIITCAFAFTLTAWTMPLLVSIACLAQVAACALGVLLDIVGNLSDANLVATENAEQYARCLTWMQAHLSRIDSEIRKLFGGVFATCRPIRIPNARSAARPCAPRTFCSPTGQLGRAVT